MQYSSQHSPKSLNLDKSFGSLSPTESYYILNHTSLLNINGLKGSNSGKGKPLPANYEACEMESMPAGETYTIGGYRSPLTKELYSWHYNSNGVNYILRTSNNGCEIVYTNNEDNCLPLSAEPRNSIENWRAYLAIEKVCANRDGKQLIWVNGIGDIYQMDVEAAIATDFFTTPFFDICPYPCAYIRMCVPDPCDCLKAEWIPITTDELSLNNYMLDKPFQLIYKHVYYDGRESEWSLPSTTYYQSTKGCDTTAGFSRCMKFRVPIGNPLVDKIKIGFSNGGDVWYLTEVVEKYKKYNSSQEKWYERQLAELLNYSEIDCSFDYIFCNDKQKLQIDPVEISRVYNPIPRDVQGLINIKEALGFYNYVQGNCPLDKLQIEKFNITTDCSAESQGCVPEYSTVTVRAIVFNTNQNWAGVVYREGNTLNEPDDISVPALWGTHSHDGSTSYGLQFNSPTRNFIAYVEGTDYWAEAKQWIANNSFTDNEETGIIALPNTLVGLVNPKLTAYVLSVMASGKYYYEEFKIRVPKGQKGFVRITSHFSTNGEGESQNTSTSVIGTLDIRDFQNGSSIDPIWDTIDREVYFDTCNGDVELFDAFVIRDLSTDGDEGSAYTGYIKDGNDNPVEGADISFQSPVGTIATTDHNGFYAFHKSGDANADIYVRVEQSCASGSFPAIKTLTIQGAEGVTTNQDLTVNENDYDDEFYANVIVPVKDCDGNAVAGVRVALSGTKYKVTDLNGNANFKIRNYMARDRVVTAVVLNNNGCYLLGCDEECNPCMPSTTESMPACFDPVPTITMDELILNVSATISEVNGLKSGGRYEWAVLVKGDCGRISAAYPISYMDIPKTQEKGFIGFCNYSYEDGGMGLPAWGKCLQILRSANLNNYELQWKVDKIEKTADGKIKLTIQSLNDYNNQYGFQTNTTYQWVKGDRIEFISNGDGSILSTASNGVLNYLALSPFYDEIIGGESDPPADFFNQLLINDDGRLDDITEGAIIEMQRPIPATSQQIYYSICATIPIVNGALLYPYGTFSTFDTFLVNRTITSSTGSFVGTFEHHSPSDFWGERISDAGKRYVANQFENERRFGRNIAINSPTIANFFDTALVKTFDAKQQGDIVAMNIIDGRIIQAICENDNFMAQSADELVRVGGDGIIRALPPDAIISDAEAKPYGSYGCQYDDIGSIFFGDGYTVWVDSAKKVHVRHDYNAAKDVSENRTSTYFRVRCQEKEKHNAGQSDALNKYRWATGLNYQTGEVFLTLKTLRLSSIYNYTKPFQAKNDTIIYHPLLDEYLGFASFTPEFYGQVDLSDEKGCCFITFSQGKPFIHPVLTDIFNSFYGIAVDEIIGIVINQYPEKEKNALAMEVQSELRWFASEVITNKPNFISEIPVVRWKRSNSKWNASFLFNKNSRSGLYGNSKDRVAETTRGNFIAVTLIRDNTDELKYGTIDNALRVKYDELDLILTKFSFIEQSGFVENL